MSLNLEINIEREEESLLSFLQILKLCVINLF